MTARSDSAAGNQPDFRCVGIAGASPAAVSAVAPCSMVDTSGAVSRRDLARFARRPNAGGHPHLS